MGTGQPGAPWNEGSSSIGPFFLSRRYAARSTARPTPRRNLRRKFRDETLLCTTVRNISRNGSHSSYPPPKYRNNKTGADSVQLTALRLSDSAPRQLSSSLSSTVRAVSSFPSLEISCGMVKNRTLVIIFLRYNYIYSSQKNERLVRVQCRADSPSQTRLTIFYFVIVFCDD
ncbi:hypothetical protein PUN28_018428 [Cardiocondyla obscurior]|uniref:Uncharacterized protein n=1 Tax=Cardiocondyla obscurior TaxID=286306 RepID=A0AAW2EFV9_9HYME